MNRDKETPQEPGREPQMGQDSKDLKDPAKQQQQAGEGQQQQQSGTGQQYGEGSYSGTRQYNEGMKEHVKHHDIEREARDAAPVGSSRVDLQACKLEYSIVSPK